MSDKKSNWEVTMVCTVRKVVLLEQCTEREARESPWDHATNEREVGQTDWKIVGLSKED